MHMENTHLSFSSNSIFYSFSSKYVLSLLNYGHMYAAYDIQHAICDSDFFQVS